jgi:hypothetical protein
MVEITAHALFTLIFTYLEMSSLSFVELRIPFSLPKNLRCSFTVNLKKAKKVVNVDEMGIKTGTTPQDLHRELSEKGQNFTFINNFTAKADK